MGKQQMRSPRAWLPEARRQEIARRVHAQGRVTVAELAQRLEVSEETVRRDLDLLARRGLVERTHGGAVVVAWTAERTFAERARLHAEVKARMAAEVAAALADIRRLVLDAGTSTAALAHHLRGRTDLEVITNSLPAATALAAADGVQVRLVGGALRPPTLALTGDWATQRLGALRAEACVLGANGLSSEHGLYTPTAEEAATKQAMIDAAEEVWVVADSSKFTARPQGHRFARWAEVTHLVTDRGAPEEEVARLRDRGVDVRLV